MIGRLLCSLGLHAWDPWHEVTRIRDGQVYWARDCRRPLCWAVAFKVRHLEGSAGG